MIREVNSLYLRTNQKQLQIVLRPDHSPNFLHAGAGGKGRCYCSHSPTPHAFLDVFPFRHAAQDLQRDVLYSMSLGLAHWAKPSQLWFIQLRMCKESMALYNM